MWDFYEEKLLNSTKEYICFLKASKAKKIKLILALKDSRS